MEESEKTDLLAFLFDFYKVLNVLVTLILLYKSLVNLFFPGVFYLSFDTFFL